MNRKIVGIFICLIIIFLFFQPFISADILNHKKNIDNDVPIWEVGDKWVYNIDEIEIYFLNDTGFIKLEPSNLILEVSDVTSNVYIVDFKLKLSGNLKIFDRFDLKFGGLLPISLNGIIEYNKSDIGIKNIDFKISGVCKIKLDSLPFLSIPVRFDTEIYLDSSTPLEFISFPIAIGNYWNIKSTILSIDGFIKSPWLRVINLVHNILRFFNYIPDPYMELSDKIADILPVIKIKETLSAFNISNHFFINESDGPPRFICIGYEQIIVEGDIFECYNITIADIASIYYSAEIGNIAKFYIYGNLLSAYPDLQYYFSDISNISIELIEIN
jgi:hypothetical protein